MKKIITLFTAVCLSLSLAAQYYYVPNINAGTNPGGLNNDDEYPSGGGLPAGWTNIITGSAATPVWSSNVTIPFAFSFNGTPVTQFKVSSSAILTFDIATVLPAPSYTRAALPNASIPNNSVCIWGLSGIGSNDYVISKTFGSAPNRQFWIQFNSFGYGTVASDGSNFTYWSIVLQETTNQIHIVDQRTGGYASADYVSAGIQLNSTTAYSVALSPNLAALAGTSPTPSDNTYYTFIQGTQQQWDFSTTASSVPAYLVLSAAPFSITGTVRNMGSQTVTSFDMNYSVNSGPTVTANIGPVNIAPNATYNFTHPTGWTPSVSATYNITAWASNLNGNPDGYAANDNLSFSTQVVDTFVVHQSCIEVFTSSTCGPCAPGNLNMEQNVIPFISNYTVIKYQQDFPGSGDPYRTPEAVNRRGYYAINSIPRLEIDGQWDGNAQLLTTAIYNSYQAIPSFMTINIASATYTGTTVSVSGTITPHINYGSGTYRYHVVVTEKQTLLNTATNGETEFLNVMMNMEPTETGNVISALNSGTPIAFNKTISLPYGAPNSNTCCHVEEMSDLRVVVFVQNNVDKKILQSKWQDVVLATGVAEIDAEGDGIAAVYPNPVNNFATVKFQLANSANAAVTVTNIMGQVVYQNDLGTVSSGISKHSMNTESFPNGIYNVTLQVGGKLFTHKFIINR